MSKSNKFAPEVCERAVRMLQEHRGECPSLWAAIESIAPTIGCVPLTLNEWVTSADVDAGVREGVSYDHALAETINGLYRAELIHRRAPWKTKESVEFATLEWVSWFNHHRLLEPIGYIPPAEAEAEADHYRQLANQATAVVA